MFNAIVMTVGTSIFNPNHYFGQWSRKAPYFHFNGNSNPQLPSPQDDPEQVIQEWLAAAIPLIHQREWKPELVSAEYSLLNTLQRQNRLGRTPKVSLFHTDTLGGTAAAKLLEKLLSRDFSATVDLYPVHIDVTDRTVLNRLLGDYMSQLSQALHKSSLWETCFAPIGGYKVMTSLGYIVGSFHNFPTAYLHEEAQQMLHIIPPVPISVDESFIETHSSFIRRLYRDVIIELAALSPNELELVENNPSIFTIEENLVYLNPFGEYLLSRSQHRSYIRTKIYCSQAVRDMIRDNQQKCRFVYQQIGVLSHYLPNSEIEKRGELFHERDFEGLKGMTLRYHLYKGASNGGVFRAAWRYDHEQDELYINYVWLKKPYEHEVLQGKGLLKDEGDFVEIISEIYDADS